MANSAISVKETKWDLIIKPSNNWLNLHLRDIWRYKDLLFLFVRRDFVALYKQTILGPLWFFIQPILTTITFTVIFGNIAEVSTDGMPKLIFYLAGITLWNYFSECLIKTSDVFIVNQNIFSKVYFPRLVVPLSIVISNLLKLGIQLLLFLGLWIYYFSNTDSIHPNWEIILLTPLLIIIMAGLGLGLGNLISALTTKYRDFRFLIQFGVQLLMYASPVVYPLSVVDTKYRLWILGNPMSSVIETFKYAFLGSGELNWFALAYSTISMIVLLLISMIFFNRIEKSFVDTV